MKRILFFFLTSIVFISCKNNEGTKVKKEDSATITSDTIVINSNSVDDKWIKLNESYIVSRDSSNIYVDLSLIPENAGQTARSSWLFTNGEKINYAESGKYIVDSHTLPSDIGISLPQNSPSLTYLEIKNKINSLANDSNYFDNDKYNKYVQISINSMGQVDLDLTDYDYTADCYSIPFLRAVEREIPNVTNETEFMFGKYDAKNTRQVIFFKMNVYNRYFNISNKPPFLPETEAERKS